LFNHDFQVIDTAYFSILTLIRNLGTSGKVLLIYLLEVEGLFLLFFGLNVAI